MKLFLVKLTNVFPAAPTYHLALLLFRAAVSIELILAHGLKKIGIGVDNAETIPNPFNFPDALNQSFAVTSNLVFPLFIILGLFTRLFAIGILAVTLTGYFIVHWSDSFFEKDMPYMYSVAYLFILVLGAGKYSFDFFINRSFNKKSWL